MGQADEQDSGALRLEEFEEILEELQEQPPWRAVADKEADYADGNQIDSDLLQLQKELGVPPAIDDRIGPALLALQGYEQTVRTDWRVTPNGQQGAQDVADALSFKLNEAERHSRADRACSDAFRSQAAVGVGWVEVARSADPFAYRYRCRCVHRNEIHWDWAANEDDLSDARWLVRQRWMRAQRAALAFPQHKDLVEQVGKHGAAWWQGASNAFSDGAGSTGLRNAWDAARGSTMAEARWFDRSNKEVCVSEVWYRRWENVGVLRAPDGRVVEFDARNAAHAMALSSARAGFEVATVARMRQSFWLGPHCLHDAPSPYPHSHFPYVPFWGFREDGTRVPYGYVRGMVYQQDSLNSGISKLRWGMGVVRVTHTEGAVNMTPAQLRKTVARRDAHVELNAKAMRDGGIFTVERDYQLTQQHFDLLNDARSAIERVSAAPGAFMGQRSSATSGLQEQTRVEQANQSLGRVMDNFRAARTQVGELLLSMLLEDMGSEQETVVIEGDAVRADRTVRLNAPETDPYTGTPYLSNDVQRTRLKVALEDVPSTNSYRGQQLNAMSEAVKSLPAQYQAAAMPFLASLMDVPFKRELVEALRAAGQQESPEQIEARIKQAVEDALARSDAQLRMRDIAIKERVGEAEVKKLMAQAVQIGVQSAYGAMQGGAQIAQMPMIAPIADAIMQRADYQAPNPMGDDPNFPQPGQTAAMDVRHPYVQGQGAQPGSEQLAQVQQNTSPAFPPVPQQAGSGLQGIETARTDDAPAAQPPPH